MSKSVLFLFGLQRWIAKLDQVLGSDIIKEKSKILRIWLKTEEPLCNYRGLDFGGVWKSAFKFYFVDTKSSRWSVSLYLNNHEVPGTFSGGLWCWGKWGRRKDQKEAQAGFWNPELMDKFLGEAGGRGMEGLYPFSWSVGRKPARHSQWLSPLVVFIFL